MPRVGLRKHGESVNGPGAKGYCCVLPLLLARYSGVYMCHRCDGSHTCLFELYRRWTMLLSRYILESWTVIASRALWTRSRSRISWLC